MRCSFRTHLFSRMRFPGLAPWAGMRCPLQGNLRFLGRCPGWYALPCWGNFNNGISIPHPCHNGHRVPTCRRGSVGANRPPRFRSHAPTGHCIPAQGTNPGTPPGKTDTRSEGTPHSRVSRTSTPAHPMRCSFRTHLFSRMRFPGLAPWAGMRCPVGANRTMTFSIPCPCPRRAFRSIGLVCVAPFRAKQSVRQWSGWLRGRAGASGGVSGGGDGDGARGGGNGGGQLCEKRARANDGRSDGRWEGSIEGDSYSGLPNAVVRVGPGMGPDGALARPGCAGAFLGLY
jgi:hypothetical protein